MSPDKKPWELVVLCAGFALLVGVALVLSGNAPFFSSTGKLSLQKSLSSQPAAVATYASNGTYTWTAPGYVTRVWVTVVGAGGGGGGLRWSDGCGGDADTGGGGGSGGYITGQEVPVTPGAQYTVVVGTGGTGGPFVCGRDNPSSGAAGGGSSFGGSVIATGGIGNSSWAGGAGGTPGGGKGQSGALYYAGSNAGGTNGSGQGSGGASGHSGQNGANGYVAIYLTPPPMLTIVGNGQTGSITVAVGEAVTVSATFIPAAGDTLFKTAINNYQNNLWCGTGNICNASMWTAAPLGSKSYTFIPTAAGQYIFYPAAQTGQYSNWNNYGKSLRVIAHPVCPAGTHWEPGSPGNTSLYGSGSGRCVPNERTCPGAHQINYPTCNCDVGYILQNGACVLPTTCSDPHAVPPLCSCANGYTLTNGSCTPIPPTLSLSAAQYRVSKGNPAVLSWSAAGLVGDPAVTCLVRSLPASVFLVTMPAGTSGTWSGTGVATNPVTGATRFTLSCTGAGSVSITVNLIPVFQEI
ncbi:MAG: hypothetical protein AAB919_02095 [Patescibacteria group bacterium]